MKTSARAISALITAFVAIALILWGTHSFNTHRYAIDTPDPTHRAGIIREYGGSPVDGDYLRGIHYSAHGTPHPGAVIIFGGRDGGTDPHRARHLQDQGYDVLSLYYFGQPGLSTIPLDFFDEALTWMTDHQLADGPLTVLGSSKGAELTANLAARYPEIDHIVLYSPSEYTYAGAQYDNRAQSSSYTWHGTPVPFAPYTTSWGTYAPMMVRTTLGLPVSHRARYEEAASAAASRALNIATPLNRQAAAGPTAASRIDLTHFAGDGLLFARDMDAAWPSDTAAHALSRDNPRLETIIFDSAGHHFHENISELGLGWKTTLGGTVNGNRLAKQESDLILTDRVARWHDR